MTTDIDKAGFWQKWGFARFTTYDLMLMAVIATVQGVVLYFFGNLENVLRAAVGPVITTLVVSLLYTGWVVLAAILIRKAGAGYITALLAGALSLVLGGGTGLIIFLYATGQGGVSDLALILLGRYKKFDWWRVMIANMLAAEGGVIVTYFLFQVGELGAWALWGQIGLVVITGCAAGLVVYWLGKVLLATGIKGREVVVEE